MKPVVSLFALLTIFCLTMAQGTLRGKDTPQYLYTNDNLAPSFSNSTTGFSVSGTALTPLPGSPFATGGTGSGAAPAFGIQDVADATITPNQRCLFVSDANSNDVAAFQINLNTGALTAAPGSPYATHESGNSGAIGLAVPHTSNFVYAGNYNNDSISVFGLHPDCSLHFQEIYATPSNPIGMKVIPDGDFLIVAYAGSEADTFTIGHDGSLAENGPFPTAGAVHGLDGFCENEVVLFGDTSPTTEIEAYNISTKGVLTPATGSPFVFNSGSNSEVVAVDHEINKIYITNQNSDTQTALAVDNLNFPHLSLVDGSPFANPGSGVPVGMTFNNEGNVLFVADSSSSPQITVYRVNSDGTLTLGGPPVSTGNGAGMSSLRAVPDAVCR